jgi:hypothetical protein
MKDGAGQLGPRPAHKDKTVKTGFAFPGALAACMMLVGLGAGPAAAAGSREKPSVPALANPPITAYSSANSPATADPPTTGSVAPAAEEDANCTRSRRRLWVEGQGWVVRRVTTCF